MGGLGTSVLYRQVDSGYAEEISPGGLLAPNECSNLFCQFLCLFPCRARDMLSFFTFKEVAV